MSLLESHWLQGVACDVRGCSTRELLPELVPMWGTEARAFERTVLAAGWVKRIGRSVRWYCPEHAHRAGRCIKGKYGYCSPHCPIHGHGQVVTAASR